MYDLSGKVAFVTGAGGQYGFGRAIALRLAREGADVVVTDIRQAPGAPFRRPVETWRGITSVAEEVQNLGCRALAIALDVRSPVEVAAAVEQALAVFAHVDILVNNAGAAPGADRVPVVDLKEAEWDRVLDTNTKGAFLCSRAIAAAMIHRGGGGRIINMSSDCGKLGFANKAAYCASKFALIGFTQALAMELAPFGITVNAICPGLADTERIDYYGRTVTGEFDERRRAEEVAQRGKSIPLGRLASVEDVAQVTAFLASSEAAYLTGQAINVSGGAIMH